MINLRALAVAPAARAWLAQTASARMLNGFDRAVNLVNAEGEVLAVVRSERALTPFALVVAAGERAPFRVLTETSEIRVQPHRLELGPFAIEVEAARLWEPSPDWPAIRRLRLAANARWLDRLWAIACGRGPTGSLLELFDSGAQGHSLPAALRGRARSGALELVAGMQSGVLETALAGARRLAGLGGGLTPAGDDFVLGVLLAAWAGIYGAGAERQTMLVAEAAAPLTTTLSAAYLRAAARGECSAYWHGLFAALLQPDVTDMPAALAALLAVGHTSGADAVAGFLAARLALPGVAFEPATTTGV